MEINNPYSYVVFPFARQTMSSNLPFFFSARCYK